MRTRKHKQSWLYDRFLFESHKKTMYKIVDKKTGLITYRFKSFFDTPVRLWIDNKSYDVRQHHGHIQEVNLKQLEVPSHTVHNMEDIHYLCLNNKLKEMVLTPLPTFQVPSSLVTFNHDIQQRCPDLSLRLDYAYKLVDNQQGFMYQPDSVILCLRYKHHCISTLWLDFQDTHVEISSVTQKSFRGNKYNILLRALLILTAHEIRGSTTVISNATNPISVWILIKYFYATYDSLFQSYVQNTPITFDLIKSYFRKHHKVSLQINLSEESLTQAMKIYIQMLHRPLICP